MKIKIEAKYIKQIFDIMMKMGNMISCAANFITRPDKI